MTLPTDEQAQQFAIMVNAGLPPSQAILYFVELDSPADLAATVAKWQRSKAVQRASSRLMTKSWQDMTLDERCRHALDHHYSQLAYVLYSQHYAEVAQQDKAKLDTARGAIESKLAGTAGKGDALSQFWDDLRTGKVTLAKPVAVLPSLGN